MWIIRSGGPNYLPRLDNDNGDALCSRQIAEREEDGAILCRLLLVTQQKQQHNLLYKFHANFMHQLPATLPTNYLLLCRHGPSQKHTHNELGISNYTHKLHRGFGFGLTYFVHISEIEPHFDWLFYVDVAKSKLRLAQ